ncbi:hypothetical protein C8R47DRAFT_8740 [Mycena vitilis]|nr:hypothetical protein C8R47DRAFT_8740 [Mycena vitilis]
MSANLVLDEFLIAGTLCACATLLTYDWICTLDQEVARVWSRPWSTGTLFFVLNRYLPFVDISISLSARFTRISPERCLTENKAVAWFTVLGIFLSEVILMLRTFALWDRSRGALIALTLLALCTAVPTIVFTQLELMSLGYVAKEGLGCQLAKASSIIIFAYIMLMVFETTNFVLTAIKAYRDLRRSRQPWLVQLYRDGLLFYVYLLAISLANILVPILAPPMYANWLASPQRILHSVLCTRVLLLLRGGSQSSSRNWSTARTFDVDSGNSLVFAPFPDRL